MTPDPFHFIHKCQIGALPFFYWKGEGHLFWQYFTVPGTGFDTTSFRNSNHNKFGRHFFSFCKEAQDYLAERLLFSLVNFMWALAGWVFPWVERGNILSCTDSENSIQQSECSPAWSKLSSYSGAAYGHVTLYHNNLFLHHILQRPSCPVEYSWLSFHISVDHTCLCSCFCFADLCLFLCQCHTVFIIPLKWSLKSRSVIPPALFFLKMYYLRFFKLIIPFN